MATPIADSIKACCYSNTTRNIGAAIALSCALAVFGGAAAALLLSKQVIIVTAVNTALAAKVAPLAAKIITGALALVVSGVLLALAYNVKPATAPTGGPSPAKKDGTTAGAAT